MATDHSQALIVRGLQPLQSSLKKAEGDIGPKLKLGMKTLGRGVLHDAQSNAPVGPRPKRSKSSALAGSLKVSVTTSGVSIYSNAPHAYVQDRGGKVGGGAIVPRASASGYMTKAVSMNRAKIALTVDKLLTEVQNEIHT